MLPLTRKCNPPRLRSWVSLAATGIVIAAMPTLLAVSATAQPGEPIRPEPAASTTEEAPVVPEATSGVEPSAPSASGRANNQPAIADPPAQPEQPEPAEEVPAQYRKRGSTEMRPEVLSWAAPAGSGPFMDIVTLANGYVEALGGIRTGEINLLRQQDLLKKGATSKFDVARVRADLENARMRADLSRSIAQIARRDTQRELEWLEQQRRIYEALGETVVPKVKMLAIERDRDLAQGRLEMLEAILSLED